MTPTRPYVDRPVPDRPAGADAARAAAAAWDLPAPELLRHGMNSLYRCGRIVLRVGAATASAAVSHALARWLIDSGVDTVPPVDGLCTDVGELAVTGWRFVPETRRAVDWTAVGRIVRRVHELDPSCVPDGYPTPDPSDFPWWDFDAMLAATVDDIDAEAHDAIAATVARHAGWSADVRSGAVVCHGDVHPGNVLMSATGPLLIDWDLLCRAHPAWDHAMLATFAGRWGGDPTAYPRFVTGYGGELAERELVAAIGDLRNVAATLMRVQAGRTDDAAHAEAQQRLRYWRGDPDAPLWRAQ